MFWEMGSATVEATILLLFVFVCCLWGYSCVFAKIIQAEEVFGHGYEAVVFVNPVEFNDGLAKTCQYYEMALDGLDFVLEEIGE